MTVLSARNTAQFPERFRMVMYGSGTICFFLLYVFGTVNDGSEGMIDRTLER